MSTLKELLKKHCPNGVEFKKMSDICKSIKTGKLDANAMEENGKYRFYTCAKEYYKINTYAFDCEALLISGNGANVGYIHYYKGKFNAYQRTYVLTDFTENILYIKYFLDSKLKERIDKEKKTGNTPYIRLNTLTDMIIPVPPIEVQKEIVRILDEFTEKTTKLQELLHKETVLRKKQYEYYREKLLFNDNFDKVNMSDICEIKYGKALKEKDRKNGEVEVYSSGGLIGWHNEYLSKTPSIIIGRKGSAGSVFYTDKSSYCIDTAFYINESNCNLKFIYYVLLNFELHKHKKTDGVPGINRDYLYNLKIPVPPLEEQERIVNILDKFDALCNDITRGLPAEIEMRKKQYEYYRDKLLTFKEKKV
ncbi:restriction endonuclease subunit S [uncultured Brachyspira sp.]|uniref:restriction endonuclease subunit S n=1 Tax=uncultured Brachyspira sp. TaxID=221953 RepID=UPI00259A40AD|nr:restriction endonuclease subunit S [uncultured Brachyspira sp.]